MKKIIKFTGGVLLLLILCALGFGGYKYQTDDFFRAMIQQDESKLYYYPSKEIAPLDEFNYSEYELVTENNQKIFTYHYHPNTQSKKGNVFYIHGAGGNATVWASLIKPLVDSGYAVYAADWRGYGKAEGRPEYKGVYKDTDASFQHFRKLTQRDSLPTIVYGMSLGAQLAIKITMDNQPYVNALVTDGGVGSAQQIAIDYAPFSFIKNKHRKHPENFNQDYIGFNDIKKIYNIPKLIIHSRKDQGVPIFHGKKLFENANEPKVFWETETSHIMTLRDHPNETIIKIEELLK